jgi:hypothetical protein
MWLCDYVPSVRHSGQRSEAERFYLRHSGQRSEAERDPESSVKLPHSS